MNKKNKIQLTPIYKEIMGDLDTPVSIYLKLNQPQSFLLESVTGGEQVARYSFIGFDPFCTFKNDGKKNIITLNLLIKACRSLYIYRSDILIIKGIRIMLTLLKITQ